MFEPSGNYPNLNLIGITPADGMPKLQGLRAKTYILDEAPFDKMTTYVKVPMRKEDFNVDDFEEFDIRKNLFKQLFNKVKLKPPSFEEFCEIIKIYEDFDIDGLKLIYLVEYKDKVVGTLHSKIKIPLDDLGMPVVDSKDIQEAIQEYKLEMYHRLAQEYDKKNKEATIKEEKNMFYIPGMNVHEGNELIDALKKISTNVEGKFESCGFGCKPYNALVLEIPFENLSKLSVNEDALTSNHKNSWLEGIPAVKKVETYNQRVVKVTFIDDTFTKSVCSENDHFDIDVGITICLMKRLIGTNSDNATREYNRLINNVHAVMEKNEKEKLAAQAQKTADKAKKRKIELKRAAKKLKAKEEQIDIYKQAILRAQKETFSQFEDGGSI